MLFKNFVMVGGYIVLVLYGVGLLLVDVKLVKG